MEWPDVVILIVLALGALSGFRRGFVGELTGAIALTAAIVSAFIYTGSFDEFVAKHTGLGPGSAHVVGMVVFALAVYAIVVALGMVLSGFAKLPGLNVANGLGGAAVGAIKALVLVWATLFIALFFPLSPDLRRDLHRSTFVSLIESPNHIVDAQMRANLPWYVRPFSSSLFARHHV